MTYQPKTKFVGDINPFTGKPLPKERNMSLQIVKEKYPPNAIKRGKAESLYAEHFEMLMKDKPGESAIQCESAKQAKAVSYALTRWLRHKQLHNKLRASVLQQNGKAKVWVLERAEKQ